MVEQKFNSERNGLIDVTRIIMAVLVVMLHTAKMQTIFSSFGGAIARLAVPFFMCITSYYFFQKKNSKYEMIQSCKKIGTIWLFWMLIYLPKAILSIKNTSLFRIFFEVIKGFLGVSINYGGSWYLVATAFGIFIVWFLKERDMNKLVYILSLSIFLLGLSVTSYGGWITPDTMLYKMNDILMPANTFIMGIPWIYLGSLLAKRSSNNKFPLVAVFCTIGLPIIEYFFIHRLKLYFIVPDGRARTDVMLTLPIALYILFRFLETNYIVLSDAISKWCRNLSTLIFFIHFGVNYSIAKYFSLDFGVERFVIVLGITFFISIMYILVSNTQKLSWLKIGYGK